MTTMKNAISALTLLVPSLAMAHPGHSPIPATSPLHPLLAHVDGMLLVVAVALAAMLMRWAARRSQV